MGRKAVDRPQRRAEIAEGAVGLFVSAPRDSVTVEQVAEAVGMTFWQVYRTAGPVEQIYRAAVLALLERIERQIEAITPTRRSVRAGVEEFVRAVARIVGGEDYARLMYLVIRDGRSDGWVTGIYEDRIAGRVREGLERTVREAGASYGAVMLLQPDASARLLPALEAAFALCELLPSFRRLDSASEERTVLRIVQDITSTIYAVERESEAA